MSIETLGDALRAGWRARARCVHGKRDGMKSIREGHHQAELDLVTLVWTRGGPMPLSDLGARLRCPACRSLKVAVVFEPPPQQQTTQARFSDPREDVRGLRHRVEVLGPGGSFDRMVALCADSDDAQAAYDSAVARITLAPGETLTLRSGHRLIAQHPPRAPATQDLEAERAANEKLREGAPKGYKRRFK